MISFDDWEFKPKYMFEGESHQACGGTCQTKLQFLLPVMAIIEWFRDDESEPRVEVPAQSILIQLISIRNSTSNNFYCNRGVKLEGQITRYTGLLSLISEQVKRFYRSKYKCS